MACPPWSCWVASSETLADSEFVEVLFLQHTTMPTQQMFRMLKTYLVIPTDINFCNLTVHLHISKTCLGGCHLFHMTLLGEDKRDSMEKMLRNIAKQAFFGPRRSRWRCRFSPPERNDAQRRQRANRLCPTLPSHLTSFDYLTV